MSPVFTSFAHLIPLISLHAAATIGGRGRVRVNIQMTLRRRMMMAILVLLLGFGSGALAQTTTGRLDFLKSKDSSFALFANTSGTVEPGKQYPNEVVLITGLPSNPTIAARVDVGLHPICQTPVCAGLRNLALSPDGDTALATSDPDDDNVSILFLFRHVRTFVTSHNPADLAIRTFRATEFPDLEHVSGLAFGPDGTWAVANTIGPGAVNNLSYEVPRGTVVLITGLPDNPVFSPPFQVPMHSQGNIDLSVDGETLLLNDVTDRSGGSEKNNVFVRQGYSHRSAIDSNGNLSLFVVHGSNLTKQTDTVIYGEAPARCVGTPHRVVPI